MQTNQWASTWPNEVEGGLVLGVDLGSKKKGIKQRPTCEQPISHGLWTSSSACRLFCLSKNSCWNSLLKRFGCRIGIWVEVAGTSVSLKLSPGLRRIRVGFRANGRLKRSSYKTPLVSSSSLHTQSSQGKLKRSSYPMILVSSSSLHTL